MWTWFSILSVSEDSKVCDEKSSGSALPANSNRFLIVKLKHGLNQQSEIAIPISNFTSKNELTKNWLFALYRIL